jgi:DNA-binding NtrC family response regulator
VTSAGLPLTATVDRFEAELIRQALQHTSWNKNQAAKLLEMNRTTLLEKIKKHGLSPEE